MGAHVWASLWSWWLLPSSSPVHAARVGVMQGVLQHAKLRAPPQPAPSPACFLSCRSGWCPRVSRADFTFEYKYMVGRGQLLTTGRPVGRFVEQTAERARRQRCPSTVCGQAGGETRQACINQQTVARNCPCQICRRWRTPACPAMAERLAAGAGCGHA